MSADSQNETEFVLFNEALSYQYSTAPVIDEYKFNVHGSVHRNNILVYNSNKMHKSQEFILSDNCSTCFGRHYHPFQENKTTVTTASGNRYTILLSAAIVEELKV